MELTRPTPRSASPSASPLAPSSAASAPASASLTGAARVANDVFDGLGVRLPSTALSRVDVLACTKCQGRMRVLVCLEKPYAVRKILRHLGLRDTPLPVARSRGPPQPDFAWEM
jgi:hypothetical protein